MMKKYFVFPLIMIFWILSAVNVSADDCSIGKTPEGVFPISNAEVVMSSEDIYVNLETGLAVCNFEFTNTENKAMDVLMGFPAEWDDTSEEAQNFLTDPMVFQDFKTYINGVSIKVKKEKGLVNPNAADNTRIRYKSWYTFSVHFEPGEIVKVKNTYRTIPVIDSMGYVYYGYILTTGAFWKDSIRHGKVTFDLGNIKPYEISHIEPNEMEFQGNTLVWQKNNFEPTYDLNVSYNQYRFSEDFLKETNSEADENKKLMELYSKIIKTEDPEVLKSCYQEAFSMKQQALILYIRSKLPKETLVNPPPEIMNLTVQVSDTGEFLLHTGMKDEYGDLKTVRFRISHDKQGKEIIDEEQEEYSPISPLSFERSYRIHPLLENVHYKIQMEVTDEQGSVTEKTIQYFKPSATPLPEEQSVESTVNQQGFENQGQKVEKEKAKFSWKLWIPTMVFMGIFIIFAFVLFKKYFRHPTA